MNEVSSLINLYDSEIVKVEGVVAALNEKQGKTVDLEGFRKEAIGRFEEIGLKVDVLVYESNVEGVYPFDIVIQDHCERVPFDPDRMVHEVTNDLLGLGEGGVIKTKQQGSGLWTPGGHHHGPGGHSH